MVWNTDGGWDMGVDHPLRERHHPLLFLRFWCNASRHALALQRTSIDALACVRVRLILDARETLGTRADSPSAILGKGVGGPGVRKESEGGKI